MKLLHRFFSYLWLSNSVYIFIHGLDQNPDIDLRTPGLAAKYGYPLESHRVVTDDGYILEMHRIPYERYKNRRSYKSNRTPILIQHGLCGSSADWILSGPDKALAYRLADSGYDVWLGNNRGNTYSRKHLHMHPANRTFWDFSYHELGIYDLPAMIDHVLTTTSRSKLLYAGHSQGVTQFLVMTSVRPEYNSKIALAIGLAPAAYTAHLRGPVTQLARLTDFGVWVGENFGYPEFGARSNWSKFVTNLFCHDGAPTKLLCGNLLFLVTGYTRNDLSPSDLNVIVGHVPAGASWKQVVHFGQGYTNPGNESKHDLLLEYKKNNIGLLICLEGYFRAFDYGENYMKNLRLYNSSTPLEYELEKITTPIALFSSDNDVLATTEDVALLRSRLQNVILDYKIHRDTFNHYDFLWGEAAAKDLYPIIQNLIARYQ